MLHDLGMNTFCNSGHWWRSLSDFANFCSVLPEVTVQDLAGRRSFVGEDANSLDREILEIWDRICQEDIGSTFRSFRDFYKD